MEKTNLFQLLKERTRRDEHEAKYTAGNDEGWDQLRIHQSEKPILLIFGGNQSGKSHCAAKETEWRLRGKHPYKSLIPGPILAWCISTEYTTIRNGIYRHLVNSIPDWEIQKFGSKVQGHDLHSYIELKNGSRVEFYSAKGYEEARQKLQAAKVDVINIDEEIPEVVYQELMVRQLAATQPVIIISATLINSEPYITQLEERAEAGDPEVELTRLDTRANPNVNPAVLKRVMSQMDAETIEYRIKGHSRRFSGLVYRDFTTSAHTIEPFDIPRAWPRYVGLDPGLRTFAVLYLTVDPIGHKYIYDELYLHGVSLHEIAELLRIKEGWERCGIIKLDNGATTPKWRPGPTWTPIRHRVIDDKKGARLITGEWGVLEQLNITYGIECQPATKNIRTGIERCRQSLTTTQDGTPETRVFTNCPKFLKEIKAYRYRQDRTRITQNEAIQEPVRKLNHLLDCWRYLSQTDLSPDPIEERDYHPVREAVEHEEFTHHSQDFSLSEYRMRAKQKYNEAHGLVFTGDDVGGA